jgi:NAD(P)-dependent dehydrogenase (short-subunit alcohol dehydrogenase family)
MEPTMTMQHEQALPSAVVCGVGAEQGLGGALCRRFAAEGYHVLVAGRTPHKIEAVAAAITAAGGSAEAVQTDVTEESDVIRLFDRAMAPGDGRLPVDLVVYNAGNNRRIDFREVSARDFEKFWRVGCFGGFSSAARRRGGWRRSAAVRSSSPAPRRACAASPVTPNSPRRKPGCARCRRAWRVNSGRRGCMSRTS